MGKAGRWPHRPFALRSGGVDHPVVTAGAQRERPVVDGRPGP